MTREGPVHEPVLLKEVMHFLNPRPGDTIVDCTVGGGGHFQAIRKLVGTEGLVVGFDLDSYAIETMRRRIVQSRTQPAPFRLVQGNFADLIPLLKHAQIPPSGGILLDLGVSVPQLLDPRLGMSWESDEALDMRLDPAAGTPSAAEIVNTKSEEELARLFDEKSDERWSRRIARKIVDARRGESIRTGRRLGEIIAQAIPRKFWPPRTHPATRCFMALRMAVNREEENLEAVLPQAVQSLRPGGRLVVISFQSTEDRRVKRFFQAMARPEGEPPWPLPQGNFEGKPILKILTRRPVTPSQEEIRNNPRSRSARLRAAEKL